MLSASPFSHTPWARNISRKSLIENVHPEIFISNSYPLYIRVEYFLSNATPVPHFTLSIISRGSGDVRDGGMSI